jgi:ATP phosphoribosyltransferase regulatory subunit
MQLMKNMLTPIGVSDFTPDEAAHYHRLIGILANSFESKSYRLVRTGSVEYYETLAHALPEQLREQSLKFFDAGGRTLVLRPDHTTAIARLVASRMQNDSLPLRLYYTAPVFRSPLSSDAPYLEHMQGGVELIGVSGPEADAEILTLCADALGACGFKDFVFEIGHCDFSQLYTATQQQQIHAGDFAGLGFVPDMLPVSALPKDSALYAVSQALSSEIQAKTQINMSLFHGVEHYTGLVFRCYLEGLRFPIASGGRYDVLLSKFGYDQPAVGFAFDLAMLQRAMEITL